MIKAFLNPKSKADAIVSLITGFIITSLGATRIFSSLSLYNVEGSLYSLSWMLFCALLILIGVSVVTLSIIPLAKRLIN